MSGHSMYCNTEQNKRCDCYLSRRQPVARTWFETGKAHYEAGLPCDERYPLAYAVGYATAAKLVGIGVIRYTLTGTWQADYGTLSATADSEAKAYARLVNHLMRLRTMRDHLNTVRATERERFVSAR